MLLICDSDRGSAIRLDLCDSTLYYLPLCLVKQNMNRGSILSSFAVNTIQRLYSSKCRTEIPIQMGHGSNNEKLSSIRDQYQTGLFGGSISGTT